MSYSLNSLKGGYIGDYIGFIKTTIGFIKGDTRSLDSSSYGAFPKVEISFLSILGSILGFPLF